jgi:hypothetical protein
MPWSQLSPPRHYLLLLSIFLCFMDGILWSQAQAPDTASQQNGSLQDSVHELQKQVRELQAAVQEIHAEAAQYRAEVVALQKELENTQTQLASRTGPAGPAEVPGENPDDAAADANHNQSPEQRLVKVEEEQQLLSEKVNEQYQTKVESASKYRVKISGIVLINLFGNQGSVDNIDFPTTAAPRGTLDSSGNFGGSLRQSELGLEVFGPEFAGAKTSAGLQFDFSGGFPAYSNGVTEGIMRLRTGTARLDWRNTSVIAGQDTLFISPLTPTTFASLSIPAFAYAGNLWAWTPQLRIEHRIEISDDSSVLFQGGILDSLSGETPASQYFRQPQAGERSKQPGYAARVAWTHDVLGRSFTVGVGGYYGRQNWGFHRTIDGWAGTSDLSLPLNRWFSLTGEFYRGRSVGGLGGGLGRSTLWKGPLSDPATLVKGLDSTGGWTQLKFKPTETKIEFNAALGQENPLAGEVRAVNGFSGGQLSYFDSVVRNQSALANIIYRPRSDLVFSFEYRHLRTFGLDHSSEIANQISTSMGIIF